jgi:hypothetical protein
MLHVCFTYCIQMIIRGENTSEQIKTRVPSRRPRLVIEGNPRSTTAGPPPPSSSSLVTFRGRGWTLGLGRGTVCPHDGDVDGIKAECT